jgi:DNA invertase Pin-like site-specific DNA recombinase
MLQMMGAFAEFERNLIKERQREGIAQAVKNGKKIGRVRSLAADQIEEIKNRLANGAVKADLAKEYGISRPTLYAALTM